MGEACFGGACFGDSGGPILYNDGTMEVVVAIVSWGDTACSALSANYRTDTTGAMSYIQSVITANP